MKRAEEAATSSTGSSPFSSSVRPVSTTSTMQSERPRPGASSTEPASRTTSTDTPRSRKCALETRGYFVATRSVEDRASRSWPRGRATTRRQRPKPRSSGS